MASPDLDPDSPDLATLIAIAVVAGALTTFFHEAVGHGGACWLSGGHNLVISSVNEDCTVANPWIDAAGTLVNLAAGGVCWLAARRVVRSGHTRYFLWLLMTFNLLSAAGYWIFSGIGNLGDWAAILAGREPAWLWHTAMALGGAALYVWFVRGAVRALKPFLPCHGATRVARAQRLMLIPYFTYGILACVAGAFNPVGAVLIAESAAAASFGGASGLCWGWQFVKSRHFAQPAAGMNRLAMPPLRRSRPWIVAGAIVAALFIAVLGPGLHP